MFENIAKIDTFSTDGKSTTITGHYTGTGGDVFIPIDPDMKVIFIKEKHEPEIIKTQHGMKAHDRFRFIIPDGFKPFTVKELNDV